MLLDPLLGAFQSNPHLPSCLYYSPVMSILNNTGIVYNPVSQFSTIHFNIIFRFKALCPRWFFPSTLTSTNSLISNDMASVFYF